MLVYIMYPWVTHKLIKPFMNFDLILCLKYKVYLSNVKKMILDLQYIHCHKKESHAKKTNTMYTAKLLFHQSPTKHNDYMVNVQRQCSHC